MIFIITKPDCVWCDKAKKLLIDNNIPFSEWGGEPAIEFLKSRGLKTVPQIFHKDPRKDKDAPYFGDYEELSRCIDWSRVRSMEL